MGTNIKAGKRSFELEDMVEPKTFFDLGCWSAGNIGSKILKFTISEKHMYLSNKLKESNMFRVNYTQMHRGLLILGLLTECFHNHIYEEKATNIIKQSRMLRQKSNMTDLLAAIGYLEKNDSSDNMLLQNYIKYGKCQYGILILNNILNFVSSNINPHNNNKVIITPEIKTLCGSFSKEPPNSNKYKLKRDKNNERITIRVPNHIKVMVFCILKSNFIHTRLMSDIYRSGYITGLYVLCRWIVNNNLPLEEYMYGKIMHNIYDYLTSKT